MLLVLDYINSNSGVSSVVMNYYNYINIAKVQMDFLLYEEPEKTTLDYLQEKGSRVYSFGHPVKTGLGKYRKLIKNFFKEHVGEYQIVHLHIPNAAFVVLKYAKKYGVGTRILHSHNTRGADEMVKKVRNYMLNRYGISYATHYFACSKLSGEYLYGKKQADKITVINNATQLDKFRYSPQARRKIRESLAISDEHLVLGHVGRFSKQKNHEFLIEIAKKLKEKQVDFKLLLLGGGELQASIKEQVRLYNLEEQVVFAGVVTNTIMIGFIMLLINYSFLLFCGYPNHCITLSGRLVMMASTPNFFSRPVSGLSSTVHGASSIPFARTFTAISSVSMSLCGL